MTFQRSDVTGVDIVHNAGGRSSVRAWEGHERRWKFGARARYFHLDATRIKLSARVGKGGMKRDTRRVVSITLLNLEVRTSRGG